MARRSHGFVCARSAKVCSRAVQSRAALSNFAQTVRRIWLLPASIQADNACAKATVASINSPFAPTACNRSWASRTSCQPCSRPHRSRAASCLLNKRFPGTAQPGTRRFCTAGTPDFDLAGKSTRLASPRRAQSASGSSPARNLPRLAFSRLDLSASAAQILSSSRQHGTRRSRDNRRPLFASPGSRSRKEDACTDPGFSPLGSPSPAVIRKPSVSVAGSWVVRVSRPV